MVLLGLHHHDNYKGDDTLGEELGALCNTLDRLKNKIDTSRKRVIWTYPSLNGPWLCYRWQITCCHHHSPEVQQNNKLLVKSKTRCKVYSVLWQTCQTFFFRTSLLINSLITREALIKHTSEVPYFHLLSNLHIQLQFSWKIPPSSWDGGETSF